MVAMLRPQIEAGYFVRYKETLPRQRRGRRVYVGPFLSVEDARRAKRQIKAWGCADKVRVVIRRSDAPIRLRHSR